jgi:hypothetical protein
LYTPYVLTYVSLSPYGKSFIFVCLSDTFHSHHQSHKQFKLSPVTQQHCHVLPKKRYTLAGFELGPSVTQANATTTAPNMEKNGYPHLSEKRSCIQTIVDT